MMTMTLKLVRPHESFKVVGENHQCRGWLKCNQIRDGPLLLDSLEVVRAPVSVDNFRQLVCVLEEKYIEATNANIGGRSLLCHEFGFFICRGGFRRFVSWRFLRKWGKTDSDFAI
jgi:hypothetical protein